MKFSWSKGPNLKEPTKICVQRKVLETHELQRQMLDMRTSKQNCFNIAHCYYCLAISYSLYTNLDATEMIRTSEHAEGCRLDVYAFYHHQQLNELKRLAAEDPRPCLHQLRYCRLFPVGGPGPEHHVLQPDHEIPTTSGHAARSAAHCRANNNKIRCAIFNLSFADQLLAQSNCWCRDGTFKIVLSWYQQLLTLRLFMRGKLLSVVYSLTLRKDLPTYSRIFEVLHSKAEKFGVQLDPAKVVCHF
ncbi:hypothetical protein T4C_10088 [Trichinella pseudospiralis]|uniref:Uncharacterized protein n=1 Tax=Trichinella pseudospiralis TaxID=6337 RepID=A0A0V1K3P4_TRIPS|nr:hypothetical protein T4C_10088 [Trichinella pseudospiralis]